MKQNYNSTASIKKIIASFFVVLILWGVASPRAARAQWIVSDLGNLVESIKESVELWNWEALSGAAQEAAKNMFNTFLMKSAYETAVWLGSGDEKQKPLIFTKEYKQYIRDVGDAAVGEFLDKWAKDSGWLEQGLCNLPSGFSLRFQGYYATPKEPTCKFSDIQNEFINFYENQYDAILGSGAQLSADPSKVKDYAESLSKDENQLATFLKGLTKVEGLKKEEQEAKKEERKADTTKNVTEPVSEATTTPKETVENKQEQLDKGEADEQAKKTTEDVSIWNQAFLTFRDTLASKLLERMMNGFFSFATESDVSSSVKGDSSVATSDGTSSSDDARSGGIAAAKEQFASFEQASFTSGTGANVLNDFATCPPTGAQVTNCVIDGNLRVAIEDQMTVREAIDKGTLNPNTAFAFGPNGEVIADPSLGISYRNIKILKQYSVVPVGWVLAAEYLQDFGGGPQTLGSLVAAYSQCAAENYSPFCGLVDPSWVLKLPDVYCKAEGFGEALTVDMYSDDDGSPYTPEKRSIQRDTSCVDTQSCLSEDDDGACEAYGYCTKQRRIYKFQGDQCPVYEASCEFYTNSATEEEKYYLQNTLNFDDCSADNAECNWNCTNYNETSGAFTCATDTTAYTTCKSSDGCNCTTDSGETCDIPYGGISCATDSGAICTSKDAGYELTSDNLTNGTDYSIYFDRDAAECASEDAGCTEFIPVEAGVNLLANGGFAYFDGTIDDGQSDSFGYTANSINVTGCGSTAANSAVTDPYDSNCFGWRFTGDTRAEAVTDTAGGSDGVAAKVSGSSAGTMAQTVDTGQAVGNRSFVASFSYKKLTTDACDYGRIWFKDGTSSSASTLANDTIEFTAADSFAAVTSDVYTYGNGWTSPFVHVGLDVPANCPIVVDQFKLEENSAATSYTDYGSDTIYINTSQAPQCTVSEVGCNSYDSVSDANAANVNGIITNPLSELCGYGESYDLTSCSQCLEEYVGCEAYLQQPSPYNVPVNNAAGFSDPSQLSSTERRAIGTRQGKFCLGNQEKGCLDNSDCSGYGGEGQCVNSISVVADDSTSCSAAEVGCEQYVNLDKAAEGGEEFEYFKYIRQCVQPSQAQTGAGETDTYYTFEGSDQTGYQIKVWDLKVSDVDAGPCTNLDIYGTTAEDAEAACIDSKMGGPDNCEAEFGVNPACRAFYSAGGDVYYRYDVDTISVSADCHPLRNTLDDRVYHAIPAESKSCSASANYCREYTSSDSGATATIFSDNFDASVWTGGESSSEVVNAGYGTSMTVGTETTNGSTAAGVNVTTSMDATASYLLSFWAKAASADLAAGGGANILTAYVYSATDNTYYSFADNGIALTADWVLYNLGPMMFDKTAASDEALIFGYTGKNAYIDDVVLSRNESEFLTAAGLSLCAGYEGCEEYRDTDDQTHYLKSFASECRAEAVGCQALIVTENSDSPFAQSFNTNNEHSNDDVFVQPDHPAGYNTLTSISVHNFNPDISWYEQLKTFVVDDQYFCDASVSGCFRAGEAQLDSVDGSSGSSVGGFTEQYLINDPDSYGSTLCQNQQLFCTEYATGTGALTYFKDPGEKVCSYDSSAGKWITPEGMDCPLQNFAASTAPSQPLGPVCSGGLRDGKLCSSDADCPSASGDSTIYRCSSTESNDSGWVGECAQEYVGCTAYVDPLSINNELITNAGFETDVAVNSDIGNRNPDNLPDDWFEIKASTNFVPAPFSSSLAPSCSAATLSDQIVFDGKKKLTLNNAASTYCLFGSDDELIEVDENSYYTLSGHVYMETVAQDFALGLWYYDENLNELNAGSDPDAYAIAADEGFNVDLDKALAGEWHRYYGNIGPNLEREFPTGTKYVRVFLASAGGVDTSFDNVSFVQNDTYTYINRTVDGAEEGQANSCNGEVNLEGECVAFRDVTEKNLNYLSGIELEDAAAAANNYDYTINTCTFDSADADAACESRVDTADANLVVKVENDRECAEWLTCSSGRVNYDSEGNETSITCLDIGTCTKRNEETGMCLEWTPASYSIGASDDRSVVLQPGNAEELQNIRNDSGYTTIGGEWLGTCVNNICVGGANADNSCSSSANCESANTAYGFYPYDWMPERGMGGAATSDDLVPLGDFEDVFCDGETDYSGVSNYTGISAVERSRELGLRCTLDRHCRTRDTDTAVDKVFEENEIDATIENIYYEEGWCGNVNGANTWYDWSTFGTNSESRAIMQIIDYDPDLDYEQDDRQGTISALNLDLNNMLYVQPTASQFSGVQVDLKDSITPGQEYTLSFDAQYLSAPNEATDYIQIGLQHSSFPGAIDYFEVGPTGVDLVFIIDDSWSMAPYIDRVRDSLINFTNELNSSDISYRVAIIVVGSVDDKAVQNGDELDGEPGLHILDFTDYNTGDTNGDGVIDLKDDGDGGYLLNDFGAGDGIEQDFSSDANQIVDALKFIAAVYGVGSEQSYEPLVNIVQNKFPADGDFSLNFNNGLRYVLLLTDETPEQADTYVKDNASTQDWITNHEENLKKLIPSSAYVLNTITLAADAENANSQPYTIPYDTYDDITEHLGGKMYNISNSSYSAILSDIKSDIAKRISSPFRFSTNYEHYALGPITVLQKAKGSDSTTLFIGQTVNSSNVPFVIDNISLKPALEVNSDNNPNSLSSSWLVDRSCRAYPQDSSLECAYRDDSSGVLYEGWQGYCIEKDAADSSRCVTWWPVDIIAGEHDLSNKLTMRYSGKYPVYQCLVAKGNADLGVCTDDGTLCSSNNDCGNGQCQGNGVSKFETKYNPAQNENIKAELTELVDSNAYVVEHKIGKFGIDGYFDSSNLWHGFAEHDDYGFGHIARVAPTALEKNIHISEIDQIEFDKGDADEMAKTHAEAYYSGYKKYNTTNLEVAKSGTPLVSFGKSEVQIEGYQNWIGYNSGIWCGENPCTTDNIDDYLDNDISFVYFQQTSDVETKANYACGAITSEDCTAFNPFSKAAAEYLDLTEDSKIWKGDHCQGATTGANGIYCAGYEDKFESEYLVQRWTIFSVVRFKDGYLSDLYFGMIGHSGSGDLWRHGDDKWLSDVGWNFYLKEPCLLAVEGVDDEANTTPWQTRTRQGSTYQVPDIGYGYTMLGGQSKVYGSMGNDPRNVTPNRIDGDQEDFSDDQYVDWTASAADNLPLVYANAGVGSSLPYACIGNCGAFVCEDDYNTEQTKYGEVSCENNLWIGAGYGYCDKPNLETGETELCTKNADGSTTGCTAAGATCVQSQVSNQGTNASYSAYLQQLNSAATTAWQRYRLIFADIGDTIWYAPPRSEGAVGFMPYLTSLESRWDLQGLNGERAFDADKDDLFDYDDSDTLKECGSTRANNEYCGFRPSVSNIILSNAGEVYTGDTLPNGTNITLTFDSSADADQQPVQTIRIVWESTATDPDSFAEEAYIMDPWEASSMNGHTYTHVYTCDPASAYYKSSVGACEYYIHVQLQDNWKFCSGSKHASGNGTTTRAIEDVCTSYDSYSRTIYVKP